MWWKALANSLAHGEPPLGIARVVIWRCEECGGIYFQVLAHKRAEGKEEGEFVNYFAIRCLNCGTVEGNMVISRHMW